MYDWVLIFFVSIRYIMDDNTSFKPELVRMNNIDENISIHICFSKRKNDMAVFVSCSMKVDQLESNVI